MKTTNILGVGLYQILNYLVCTIVHSTFEILLYIPYLQQIKIVFKKPSLKNNCFEVLLPKLLIRYSFVGLVVCTGGWKNSWWVKKVEAFLKILNSIALEQCLFSSTQYVYIQISFSMAVPFQNQKFEKVIAGVQIICISMDYPSCI